LLPAGADGVAGLVVFDGGAGDSFAAGVCNGVVGFAPTRAGGVGRSCPRLGAAAGATGLAAGTRGDGTPGFAAPVGEDRPVPGVIADDGADGGGTTTPFAAGRGCPLNPGSSCPG
jgi:hypothetical protein